MVAATMRGRGLDPGPVPDARPSFADMLEGTVTIWVTPRVKIEKGVGYPDRVIGSGFFHRRRGYLLTNHHVIASEVDPGYEGFSRLYVAADRAGRPSDIPARVVAGTRCSTRPREGRRGAGHVFSGSAA